MPELITEHPGVLRHKLEAAGAECGVGVEPRVLVDCPPDRFCSLPEGEVCIYGIEEVSDMAVTDIRSVRDAACPPGLLPWSGQPQGAAVWAFTLALALWLGSWSGRARSRREQGET